MTDFAEQLGFLEACWRYLVLGVIQGITEFLPISSTAHLKVLPMILGWEDPGVSVTAVLQLGSILAVITYFKNDLQLAIKGIALAIRFGQWREPNARLGLALCVGTLPILFAGTAIKLFWIGFDISPLRGIPAIALISIFMAISLAFAERLGSRSKALSSISGIDGIIVGIAQMFALIPGVSRSGITLTISLLTGWRREEAARFSFILGIPAITFAGLVELQDAFEEQISPGILPLSIGICSAAVVSWIAIDWLLKYLQSNNTWAFVVYRLLFGVALLSWWSTVQPN